MVALVYFGTDVCPESTPLLSTCPTPKPHQMAKRIFQSSSFLGSLSSFDNITRFSCDIHPMSK